MTTSRGSAGEEIRFPVGECFSRIRGRKNVERTEFRITAPVSSSHRFNLFFPGLKSVYLSELSTVFQVASDEDYLIEFLVS
jgi:hypothetical protein